MEFSPTTYNGNENEGTIDFNVVLRTPSTRTVTVLFSTEPNTALGKYQNYSNTLLFKLSDESECHDS